MLCIQSFYEQVYLRTWNIGAFECVIFLSRIFPVKIKTKKKRIPKNLKH